MLPYSRTIGKDEELWVCSDFHLGHDQDFIWKDRGFAGPAVHDRFLLENLRENSETYLAQHPGKKLVILHLGDLSLQDDDGVRAGQFFDLGNERVCMLTTPGNHASGLPSLAGTRYEACILPEQGSLIIECDGKRQGYKNLIFTHYPLLRWPKGANGVICGHCHGNEACLNLPSRGGSSELGKILDCGVENALKHSKRKRCYFPIGEIQRIFQQKDAH